MPQALHAPAPGAQSARCCCSGGVSRLPRRTLHNCSRCVANPGLPAGGHWIGHSGHRLACNSLVSPAFCCCMPHPPQPLRRIRRRGARGRTHASCSRGMRRRMRDRRSAAVPRHVLAVSSRRPRPAVRTAHRLDADLGWHRRPAWQQPEARAPRWETRRCATAPLATSRYIQDLSRQGATFARQARSERYAALSSLA